MYHVPEWFLRIVPSSSRIVVAKTVNYRVPDGRKLLYEEGLTQRNPYIVDYEVTTEEIQEVQILYLSDRLRMLAQPSEQHGSGGNAQAASSASPGRDSLADVDRGLETPIAVAFRYRSVGLEIADVVYGVDAGTNESVVRRQRRDRTSKHGVGDADAQIFLIQRVIGRLRHQTFICETLVLLSLTCRKRQPISLDITRPSMTGTALPSCRMVSVHDPWKT